MNSDIEQAHLALVDCLSKCFLDVELKEDGIVREALYICPKGQICKGSLRISLGTIPLLFEKRRTISGITAKALNKYLLRGPTTITPQWSMGVLIDAIVHCWKSIDPDYSSVIFYGDGNLWLTLQCIVKNETHNDVLTFSFNTTTPVVQQEKKKKSKEAT